MWTSQAWYETARKNAARNAASVSGLADYQLNIFVPRMA